MTPQLDETVKFMLFGQMGNAGTIPAGVAEHQARQSAPFQALATQLDQSR